MKKLIYLFILCCLLSTNVLFSQTTEEKKSVFHVSFVPPLSTHGPLDKYYTNDVSLNILVGRSLNERVFTLGGLGNIIGNNASGVQIAGLANTIGNNANGFQLAGLLNIIGNNANGIQIGGLTNIVGNNSQGFQMAGLLNVTGENSNGIQIGGLANVTGENANGFRLAGLANIVGENGSGVLVSGLMNAADRYNGWQIAGLLNASSDINGVQFAGVMNKAGNVKGAQIAGLVNRAKTVKGVQFAGLVNIAENSDYPIGLVNVIKNGEMSVGVSYNELGSITADFRSGGRVLYGILGLGYNHRSISKESFVTEGGIGAHINILPVFRINTEAKASYLSAFSKKQTSQYSLSVLPAYKFTSNFEIFGGPSVNYLYSDNPDNKDLFPNHNIWKKYKDGDYKQVYIGFAFGVQYIF